MKYIFKSQMEAHTPRTFDDIPDGGKEMPPNQWLDFNDITNSQYENIERAIANTQD